MKKKRYGALKLYIFVKNSTHGHLCFLVEKYGENFFFANKLT